MADEKTFTQDEVNSIVKGRIADTEKRHEVYLQSIKDEHQSELAKLNDQIANLTTENGQLKDKALKVDELTTKLADAESKVAEFTTKEEMATFNAKLKELGIKEERLEAFGKLLGDDKSDEAIKALTEQLPEWVKTEDKGTPSIVVGGNPNAGAKAEYNLATMTYDEVAKLKAEQPDVFKQLTQN